MLCIEYIGVGNLVSDQKIRANLYPVGSVSLENPNTYITSIFWSLTRFPISLGFLYLTSTGIHVIGISLSTLQMNKPGWESSDELGLSNTNNCARNDYSTPYAQNCAIKITVKQHLKSNTRASLVAQWLGVCLPMQGTRVRALVWEDPTCRGATGPVSHNYWACASGACAPQQERLR